MIIGYIIVAGLLAALSSVIAVLLGAPLWVGLGLYAGVGSACVFLHACIRLAFGASQTEHAMPMAAADVPLHTARMDSAAQPEMRILAVDDDPFILELLPIIAARNGFSEMKTASSAAVALEILNGDPSFDCLLLDISMPEMDGIELCRHIRALSAYRTTPIIMLTAMRDLANMSEAFRVGATDYATKPFDVAVLGARLHHAQEEIAKANSDIGSPHPGDKQTVTSFNLPDDLEISGVNNLVHLSKLENYLTGITGKEIAGIVVFALRTDPMAQIYNQTTRQEFTVFLADVANAAAAQFNRGEVLMAFDGNGNLLIVTETLDRADQLAMEEAIEGEIKHWSVPSEAKGLPQPMISIGRSVRPNAVKTHRASLAFENAISSVESRTASKVASEGVEITGTIKVANNP